MSTSANVTYYQIYKNGKFIEQHRQNCMCKFKVRDELAQYQPAEDYTLICLWPDEDEAPHYTVEMPLNEYMGGKKLTWKERD